MTYALIEINRWKILRANKAYYKDTEGKVFAVGYSPRDDSGFVSNSILTFTQKTMELRTTSGGRIKLVGPPGDSRDADEAWKAFATRNRVTDVQDMTSRYQPRPKRGRPPSVENAARR